MRYRKQLTKPRKVTALQNPSGIPRNESIVTRSPPSHPQDSALIGHPPTTSTSSPTTNPGSPTQTHRLPLRPQIPTPGPNTPPPPLTPLLSLPPHRHRSHLLSAPASISIAHVRRRLNRRNILEHDVGEADEPDQRAGRVFPPAVADDDAADEDVDWVLRRLVEWFGR